MRYLPTTNEGLLNWSANFDQKISDLADPTVIGLSADEVAQYTAAQKEYADKLAASTHPDTRGGSTINAKNIAKKELIRLSRKFAMAMTNYPGVNDEQRYNFGLTVRDTEPTPVPKPDSAPDMKVLKVYGRTLEVRLRDADNPDRRGKPTGVSGAAVFSYVGENQPATEAEWVFEGNMSKTNFEIDFPETVPNGSKVWLTAYWFNTTKQAGPPTTPISTHLGFDSTEVKAAA